jgi:tetratricopeptide (TPR) repeat protein
VSPGETAADREDTAYARYRRGTELLASGNFEAAAVALEAAACREPDKSSIREALGRAYFRARRYREAAAEFEAVVERHPVNDYAHFCLGRALTKCGSEAGARRHLAIAANLRPERRDYRLYRDRLRRAG